MRRFAAGVSNNKFTKVNLIDVYSVRLQVMSALVWKV